LFRQIELATLDLRKAARITMLILSFPGINQNVRAALRALQGNRMLSIFCTTLAWSSSSRLMSILPFRVRKELSRRTLDEVEPGRIVRFPLKEIQRIAAHKLGISALTRHETGWASVDAVSQDLDGKVARLIRRGEARGARGVYAYEYCALRTFRAAAESGLRRFYELPIGYWRAGRRLMEEERELQPDWAVTIETLRDSPEKLSQKDLELESANHIIVPSDFVRDTLREHPSLTATIDVIPYGAPAAMKRPRTALSPKLRLLYVGHLSQRKGLSYLFQAMRKLEGLVSLTLIGRLPEEECPALMRELERHEWLGTLTHERVLEVMARHDVMVFPSLFEGFALVILEAMARGLPVITTPNSGGSMAIEDGKDGFIVPIRDPDAIAERITWLTRDRNRLSAMSIAASNKADSMSWLAYEKTFSRILRSRLENV
jgi:glycosyltransferase involved in cell wall biosynthesis